MATYGEIQSLIRQQHGITVQTCWIAHVKEQCGLPMRKAANRQGSKRVKPCPPDKKPLIEAALRHFRMIQ